MVVALERKTRDRLAYVYFLALWLCFSVFAYAVLATSQANIFNAQIEAEDSYLRELIGWELSRRSTWAVLVVPSLLGIFFLMKSVKNCHSPYELFLASLAYLGFTLLLGYCVLKLLRSYQIVRMYEVLLGRVAGVADPVQCFLFASEGTLESHGAVTVSALLGAMATWLFQVFQFSFPERRKEENTSSVERALTLLEKEEGKRPRSRSKRKPI